MKKVIYTAIMGNYDPLIPLPGAFREGWGAVCFSDQPLPWKKGWEIVKESCEGLPPAAASKKIKILSHKYLEDAETSVWIDGSIKVTAPLDNFICDFMGQEFVVALHPDRFCVYEEMDAIVASGKADPEKIELQRKAYRENNFPERGGLAGCGIILRRNCPSVQTLNEEWWRLTVQYGTWRDQLTFPLAIRNLDYHPTLVPKNMIYKYFQQIRGHRGSYRKGIHANLTEKQ